VISPPLSPPDESNRFLSIFTSPLNSSGNLHVALRVEQWSAIYSVRVGNKRQPSKWRTVARLNSARRRRVGRAADERRGNYSEDTHAERRLIHAVFQAEFVRLVLSFSRARQLSPAQSIDFGGEKFTSFRRSALRSRQRIQQLQQPASQSLGHQQSTNLHRRHRTHVSTNTWKVRASLSQQSHFQSSPIWLKEDKLRAILYNDGRRTPYHTAQTAPPWLRVVKTITTHYSHLAVAFYCLSKQCMALDRYKII